MYSERVQGQTYLHTTHPFHNRNHKIVTNESEATLLKARVSNFLCPSLSRSSTVFEHGRRLSRSSLMRMTRKVIPYLEKFFMLKPFQISVFSFQNCGPGSVVGIATGYGLDGPRIESRWGARFSVPVHTGPGAHPASCTMDTGSFSGVKNGRGVTLTPHPLLVP
jgi:hypothetical protein